jgi:molybdenum cofactor biosynthesis enzyme MoaA
MTIPTGQTTTVIDVTYHCNATCGYCQWGNSKNQLRKHLQLQEILRPFESLKALCTKRIVLSGGESSLHPQLAKILAYYGKFADALIILTNGYGSL